MNVGDKVWFVSQVNYLRGAPYRGIVSEIEDGKIILVSHTGRHLVTIHGGVIDTELFDLLESRYEGWKFNNPVDMTIPTKQSMLEIIDKTNQSEFDYGIRNGSGK